MDWNEVTVKLLDLLPRPAQAELFSKAAEPVSRHTWELANQVKDGLVLAKSTIPSAVYATDAACIVFEFRVSELVLVVCSVHSSEISVWMIQAASRILNTLFEAPFEHLERMTKGIAVWLDNLLKSNSTTAPADSFAGE